MDMREILSVSVLGMFTNLELASTMSRNGAKESTLHPPDIKLSPTSKSLALSANFFVAQATPMFALQDQWHWCTF